jgi:TP53 regulating kinase and related kinases
VQHLGKQSLFQEAKMSDNNIIKQGAEAKIYIGDYQGKECLIKERFVKNYRLPELDKSLTKTRVRAGELINFQCH